MQVVDANGNIFGNGLEITGPDGKPKTSGGGGSPTGPAGGDLSGSYPNPGVVWNNGIPTYDLQYYSITNPSGFITSATAAATYQPLLTLTTTGSSGPATLTGSTLNIPQYGGGLTVGTTPITSGTVGRILFEGTGNVLQQSANLFWDNTNGRLGIGTASPSATLHTVGSITASGAIAIGNYMQPTLVAAANNDVMVGLDIAPTFTNGAFTGVTNFGLRSSINYAGEYNGILIRNTNSTAGVGVSRFALGNNANTLLCGLNAFSSVYGSYLNNSSVLCTFPTSDLILATNFSLANSGTSSIRFFTGGYASGQQRMQIFSTGNVAIGTTTDAGYKLDVNGTARVSGAITGADGSSLNGIIFDGGGTRRIRPSINSLDITDSAGAIGFSISSSGTTISQSFNSVQFVRGLNSMVHSQGATQIMTFTLRGQYVNHLTPFSDIVASGYAPSAPSGNNTTLRIYTTNTTSGIYGNIIISHNGTSKTGNVLIGTSTNVASAIVNVDSTTQGFLPPRMTNAQMLAIATPAAGLVVYDTTNNKHCGYNGTAWQNFY